MLSRSGSALRLRQRGALAVRYRTRTARGATHSDGQSGGGGLGGGEVDLSSVREAAAQAFGAIEFDASLDDETRKLYETEIAAEFERTMAELEAVGEELKMDNAASLEGMQKLVDERLKEFERQNEAILSYEKKVASLTDRVKRESANVEAEVATLRGLQEQLETDPLLKLSNYREQPLPKQMCLAAGLLFFVRGGADALSAIGDPGVYGSSAVGQLGLSIAAIGAYLFL